MPSTAAVRRQPQDVLAAAPGRASTLTSLPTTPRTRRPASRPSTTSTRWSRWSRSCGTTESSSFAIDRTTPRCGSCACLPRCLRSGKKAVFFMTPLNRSLVEEYDLIDPEQYAANVGVLRGVVEARVSRSSTTTRVPRSSRRATSPTSATPPTRVAAPSGSYPYATLGDIWGPSSRDLRRVDLRRFLIVAALVFRFLPARARRVVALGVWPACSTPTTPQRSSG